MLPGTYMIYGCDPSYYTRMVEAAMRYMRVPHQALQKSPDVRDRLEARAGTHLMPVVETPEGWVIHDSTYITQLLDMRFPGQTVIPRSPVQRILCRVLDDWIDEWFVRAALHLRWIDDGAAHEAAGMISHDLAGAPKDRSPNAEEQAMVDAVAGMVLPWGRKAMGVMAAGAEHQDAIRGEFARFVTALETHFRQMPALFGARLSLADLSLLGAMKAHFATDSLARDFVASHAPGLLTWSETSWDRQCGDEDWLANDAIPATLEPLFALMQDGYCHFLPANRKAVQAGEKWVVFTALDQEVRMLTRKGAEQSRQALIAELAAMAPADRGAARQALSDRGLLTAYED
ncbi:glutathione S-transferase N-terminal domain-containing protein [Hyphomonadaceae bacterium BL14]|nr:glutathione S-transferase N-terminal domain-containing protein [Hyphomonadaceae bacterium BL14]